ncbi:MAG: right-handed parallel beta-helix repeat-containing protein [Proteobacteria bacterium]|nr:right-handed parallel beta-helix repeat-containing protein [Pseudomonadota bacterium]
MCPKKVPLLSSSHGYPNLTRVLLGLLCLSTQMLAHAEDISIYVSPDGNDNWSGKLSSPSPKRTDGPLQTLEAAQKAVRFALAKSTDTGQISVIIAPGRYLLRQPLVFEPQDSGTQTHPVRWKNMGPGQATITGAIDLKLLNKSTDREFKFAPPQLSQTYIAGGGQLYINDTRAILARQPNLGEYWYVAQPAFSKTDPIGGGSRSAFQATKDQWQWLNSLSKDDHSRAIVDLMHSWNSGLHRLASNTSAQDLTVDISPPALHIFHEFGESQRFYIENIEKALDSPQEWIATPSAIRYIPREVDKATSPHAVLPQLETLLLIRGDVKSKKWVENIIFDGLQFSESLWLTPPAGFTDQQAAVNVGAAITVDGARNISIENCTINRTGGYGVWFRESVRNSKVQSCKMDDLGAGGIKIGKTKQVADDINETGNNAISNNIISNTGKIHPGAVGIWIGQSYDNTLSKNTIFNTTYTGISIGWDWTDTAPTSGRNVIKNNLLYNIGMGNLADLGGIYTTGYSPGTVISNNVIREVRSFHGYGPGYGAGPSAWGIYNDAKSRAIKVSDNIIIGTDGGSYFLNLGKEVSAIGNVFALGQEGEIFVAPIPEKNTQRLIASNNIIIPLAKSFISIPNSKPPNVFLSNNLVASSSSSPSLSADVEAVCQECRTTQTAVETTPLAKEIRVTSPDKEIRSKIKNTIEESGSSLNQSREDQTLSNNSNQKIRSSASLQNPAPSALNLSGEDLLNRLVFSPPPPSVGIKTTKGCRTQQDSCLILQDSPSYQNSYDPHTYLRLSTSDRYASISFYIKLDNASDFIHEWRDASLPHATGISLRITPNGFFVGNKVIAPSSTNTWMKVNITADLNNAWILQVAYDDGRTAKTAKLPFVNPNWHDLKWIGFISNARVSTQTSLSDITISTK